MKFKPQFEELAQKYHLTYQYQEFPSNRDMYYFHYTHSLYNESGCFTVCCLPQLEEVSCYLSSTFSNNLKELRKTPINIYEIKPDIWKKRERIWIFKIPFYYWFNNNVISTLLEVIASSFETHGEFAGIKVTLIE